MVPVNEFEATLKRVKAVNKPSSVDSEPAILLVFKLIPATSEPEHVTPYQFPLGQASPLNQFILFVHKLPLNKL
jgi:hypothetical protein